VASVPDDAAYKRAWQTVADYYQQQYGLTWDPSEKDVCRLCFVSWDPHLYVNPAAQRFPVPARPAAAPHTSAPPSLRRSISGDRRDYYARQALNTATRMIDASTPGTRHFWRRKAAYLLGGYVAGGILSSEEARAVLEAAVDRNTEHLKQSMKTIDACLAAGMQDPITLEALEQERQGWRTVNWRQRARVWAGTLRAHAVEGGTLWH
jgi:hypothetical protein